LIPRSAASLPSNSRRQCPTLSTSARSSGLRGSTTHGPRAVVRDRSGRAHAAHWFFGMLMGVSSEHFGSTPAFHRNATDSIRSLPICRSPNRYARY
jgi:hypothetical protein